MNAAAAGDGGCCCFGRSARIKMFVSIFYSLLAVGGSLVCFVYSVLGLVEGPLCLFNTTLHNEGQIQLWDYPFCTKSISVENYLHDPSCWKTCVEPMNIVLWNIVFFSSLIAVSSLEALLCSFQILNGCWGCIFGR
ncbi:transmembrane 4 L6 family member 1-like [Rhinoraja longicauda]